MQGKTVFVTGATGFIGGALCKRLLADGVRVCGLARNPEKGRVLAATGVEVVDGDLTDHARMAEVVQGADFVMHLGAHLRGDAVQVFRAVNVDATRALAEASAKAGVERFIFTSSIAVFGSVGDAVVDESKPLREYGDPYGDSKIGAERALREVAEASGLTYVIPRPGMVYGPRSPGWTLRVLRIVRSNQAPLIEGGRGTIFPIYIDNLLDGLLLCATHPAAPSQVFNFVDDGPVTWAEFLGYYQTMLGKERLRGLRGPRWMAQLAATVLDPFVSGYNLRYLVNVLAGTGVISNRKAKDSLGWRPSVSLAEGIRRTEAWLRQEGHL
jgi:nucleoside-diphosphate-sugar epimerase